MVEVSSIDREELRMKLSDIADGLRQKYNMTVPQVRSYLKQLLEVSI